MNLPPKVEETRFIDLTPKAKKVYRDFKSTGIMELDNSTVIVENAAVVSQKCSQICSGFLYYYDTETGIRKTEQLDTSLKIKELKSILDMRENDKTVVWCKFKHSINLVAKEFAYLNPQIQTSGNDNVSARRIFQTDPNCKLIINQLSICDGYELTASDCAVYYELPHEYIIFKQSHDRVHRKGSEIHKQIMYYYLVTRGTVERSILNGLRRKKSLSDIVTGDNLREVLEGNYEG